MLYIHLLGTNLLPASPLLLPLLGPNGLWLAKCLSVRKVSLKLLSFQCGYFARCCSGGYQQFSIRWKIGRQSTEEEVLKLGTFLPDENNVANEFFIFYFPCYARYHRLPPTQNHDLLLTKPSQLALSSDLCKPEVKICHWYFRANRKRWCQTWSFSRPLVLSFSIFDFEHHELDTFHLASLCDNNWGSRLIRNTSHGWCKQIVKQCAWLIDLQTDHDHKVTTGLHSNTVLALCTLPKVYFIPRTYSTPVFRLCIILKYDILHTIGTTARRLLAFLTSKKAVIIMALLLFSGWSPPILLSRLQFLNAPTWVLFPPYWSTLW